MSLEKELHNYIHEVFRSPSESVYHYTAPNVVEIIRQSRHLKLFSHKTLNIKDKENQELSAGVEIVNEHLKKSVLQANPLSKFNQYISEGVIFYTASFCQDEKSEHALIKYGSSRIELPTAFLNHFTNKSKATLFGTVIYGVKQQKQIIADMFDLYQKLKDTVEYPEAELALWLSVAIPLFKDEKNHKDNECRVVQAEIWKDGQLCSPIASKKIDFNDDDIQFHA